MIVSTLMAHKAELEAFERMCMRLPRSEADKLRRQRRMRLKRAEKQRNRIAVAKAGRSRNFWGNY